MSYGPPDWVFTVAFWLAIVGGLTVIGSAAYGVIWLICHVRFT